MKYFGTDGIRGDSSKLNSELALLVGQAIAQVFKPKTVVIGMDTRLSSPMLAYSIANGLLALGVDVLFAGVVPTPMIAYYAKVKNICGVMITASHNPYFDNGIKILPNGYKTTEEEELLLEKQIEQKELKFSSFGKFSFDNEIKVEYLKIYDKLNLTTANINLAYDSANGANYLIAQEVFSKYAPESIQVANQPNGVNINLNCGSTYLKNLKELVKTKNLDLAFSFDGDGDRIMVIDSEQTIYDGDQIIYLIATYLKQKNLLNKNTVVLTKMSNPGILKALSDQGITYVLTDVGDKHVFKELMTNGYTIGGEASGHIILNHVHHSGDGLLVAMYLVKILTELKTTLKKMLKAVKLYPFKLTNIKNIDKSVLKQKEIIDQISEVKTELGPNSLLLVRPSGTEPLIRVTISHKQQAVVDQMTDKLVSLIKTKGAEL